MLSSLDLHIPVKGVYFNQIVSGEKVHEYRLVNDYWRRRLVNRKYRNVVLTLGYPLHGGVEGKTRLTRPYRGFVVQTIQHEHFGADPVEVYAIHVGEPE